MTQYDNKNQGTLGRNQKQSQQAAGAPEYRGKIDIEGKLYYLSAWIKENSSDGSKFFSISAKPAEQQAPNQAPAQAEQINDEDLPF